MSNQTLTLNLLAISLLTITTGCAAKHLDQGVTVRGQDGAGSNAGQNLFNRITGRGATANVPVANRLPWLGDAKSKNEQQARAHYARADEAFQQGMQSRAQRATRQARNAFSRAQESYLEAANAFPKSQLEEDSLFMIAESQFFADQYGDGFESYEKLVAKYKGTRHLDTVAARQFAIGQYWISSELKNPTWRLLPNWSDDKRPTMDTQGKALRALEKTRLNLPTGPFADDSIMVTAGWYFDKKRFKDADYHYTLIRREYPSSEHQYEAHVLGIQSKIRSYQGPDYDGTVMAEAKELIEQTLKQFVEARPDDRQRLMNLYAQVNRSLAQRDFALAEYYAGKGYNNAAGVYYYRISQEFPRTELGDQARGLSVAARGKPADPPRRFTWLSAVFPEEEKKSLTFQPDFFPVAPANLAQEPGQGGSEFR
jgi:hypothetical protein